MSVEESISDVATASLQLAQHQQLWAEIEAREESYQQAVDMGEELQTQDRTNRKEVRWRQGRGQAAAGRFEVSVGSGASGTGEAGAPAGRTRQT